MDDLDEAELERLLTEDPTLGWTFALYRRGGGTDVSFAEGLRRYPRIPKISVEIGGGGAEGSSGGWLKLRKAIQSNR